MGGSFVNDFNRFGRLYRVYVQAEAETRLKANDISRIYVKSKTTGAMIPLSTLVTITDISGTELTTRFNLLRSVELQGAPAPGYTSGQALAALEQVFAEIGETPRGKTCPAILGIIEEGQEIMKEFKGNPALDAGLLSAAQAVEHYEISRYGTLKTWAKELGLRESVKLLDATLKEEKKTDESLSTLAETAVNQEAQAA